MTEYLEIIDQWKDSQIPYVIARVIKTWGSAPRQVGSVMLVNANGEMAGSVSGGCVEGAVVKKTVEIIKTKKTELVHFGVSDESAWQVGLSCGGQLDVLIQPASDNDLFNQLVKSIKVENPAIWISTLDEPLEETLLRMDKTDHKALGSPQDEKVIETAIHAFKKRKHEIFHKGGKTYFAHTFPPRSKLIIIGAAHITADLVYLANDHHFETIVIDPRRAFTDKTVFKTPPDKLIDKYPSEVLLKFDLDAYTYCAILSHDPKIDDNALEVLLKSDVAYIGALGSRKNQEKRRKRLRDNGFSEEQISRIHGPIGADIKAKTAREIALSIMAEVISVKNQYL
ncbi:MAG: XdhC family protein, partial [Bacteroidota bacterium]